MRFRISSLMVLTLGAAIVFALTTQSGRFVPLLLVTLLLATSVVAFTMLFVTLLRKNDYQGNEPNPGNWDESSD